MSKKPEFIPCECTVSIAFGEPDNDTVESCEALDYQELDWSGMKREEIIDNAFILQGKLAKTPDPCTKDELDSIVQNVFGDRFSPRKNKSDRKRDKANRWR